MRPVSRVAMAAALSLSAGSDAGPQPVRAAAEPDRPRELRSDRLRRDSGRGVRPPARLEGRRGGRAWVGRPEPGDRRDRHRAAAPASCRSCPSSRSRTTARTSCTRSGRSRWWCSPTAPWARRRSPAILPDAAWMDDTGSRPGSVRWPCASGARDRRPCCGTACSSMTGRGGGSRRDSPVTAACVIITGPGPWGQLRSWASVLPRRLCGGGR